MEPNFKKSDFIKSLRDQVGHEVLFKKNKRGEEIRCMVKSIRLSGATVMNLKTRKRYTGAELLMKPVNGDRAFWTRPYRNKLIKTILLFAMLFTMVSCESITEGEVVGKSIQPPVVYHNTIIAPAGKVFIPMTYTYYDDEDYVIYVQGILESGDTTIQTFYVTQSAYNKINIGQHFISDSESSQSPKPDKLTKTTVGNTVTQ